MGIERADRSHHGRCVREDLGAARHKKNTLSDYEWLTLQTCYSGASRYSHGVTVPHLHGGTNDWCCCRRAERFQGSVPRWNRRASPLLSHIIAIVSPVSQLFIAWQHAGAPFMPKTYGSVLLFGWSEEIQPSGWSHIQVCVLPSELSTSSAWVLLLQFPSHSARVFVRWTVQSPHGPETSPDAVGVTCPSYRSVITTWIRSERDVILYREALSLPRRASVPLLLTGIPARMLDAVAVPGT